MITLPGSLVIKSITGSKGQFCTGDLTTDVGVFRIKDAILDQFGAGTYQGFFDIDAIFPSSYTWRGRVNVEVRARLVGIRIDDADESPAAEEVHQEPDPVDDVVPAVPAADIDPTPVSVPEASVRSGKLEVPVSDVTFDDDTLALIEAHVDVKLDPTVDRTLFRRQRDQLKALGYTFDAPSQTWKASSAN